MVAWQVTSRDPKKIKVVTPKYLKLSMSTTVQDTYSVRVDYQYETAHCKSNGHVTYGITWPQKVKVVTFEA